MLATEASPTIASRFVKRIAAIFSPLRRFPFSGPSRCHLAPGLRVTFHRSYGIYYLPTPDAIVIVRVVHGARDVPSIAGDGGFG